MPLETPIKLGPNVYYFRGDLWTAGQLHERWGIVVETAAGTANEEQAEARSREPLLRA